ncbi:MAG TPA: (2Fe-2S)-binding protein [Chitinophagaceae bacterium]|nr:(2Fe-2S)-binding protein [Chitinophagaceae bacterium]
MIQFILNDRLVQTVKHPGMALLDFIRYEKNLTGTKIGCREGDCGACSILVGEWVQGKLRYQSATSCLMALGHAHRKHIVTIEGINSDNLTPVQKAFAEEGATQCGFCTPGFVVSLTGYCVSDNVNDGSAIDAINGNICRCTGYKSIQRAAQQVQTVMDTRNQESAVSFAVHHGMVPDYFLSIPERLAALQESHTLQTSDDARILGGGTDLFVQQHDQMTEASWQFPGHQDALRLIRKEGDICVMGGAVTVSDLAASEIFRYHFPGLDRYIKLVSSTPIRHMATIAGNFTNASPIGDFSIFFLALDARLTLSKQGRQRELPLRAFFRDYKLIDKDPGEIITEIRFRLPSADDRFHFEKVSKRTHLDIASVNAAISLRMSGGMILEAGVSAGGVAPVPAFLPKSSALLANQYPSPELLETMIGSVQSEIRPISDARGSVEYKRLLLSQLIRAHFMELFPGMAPSFIPTH